MNHPNNNKWKNRFFKMKGDRDGLRKKKGHQQTYTKLHDTIPISLSDTLPMNKWNKDIAMVSCSFVYVCCVMTLVSPC